MKILLIGLGSIGQRHLRNLLLLGYTDVSVVSRSGTLPPEFSGLYCFATVDEALLDAGYDAAFICSPTSVHLSSLLLLVKAGVPNIYVEKPVSHNLEGTDELMNLVAEYKGKIVVGYDLRFDPGLQKVKELLQSNSIGKVVSVNAQVGQYLPDWRPHEDYRTGMSAKTETGGGVMLDLIHEFDYLYWLFGSVNTIACMFSNSGALQIETEDVSEVLLRFESGAIGTIHLDYLQQKLVRNCMITGYDGTIFWNLADKNVKWIGKDKEEHEFSYTSFERNERFLQIVQRFLSGENDDRLARLSDGLQSLEWVVAAKQSALQHTFVNPSAVTPGQTAVTPTTEASPNNLQQTPRTSG